MSHETQSRWALIVLATVAFFAALWVAQPVFAPLTLAFMLAVILSPLSDFWQRLGIPVMISSLLTLLVTLAALGLLVLALEPVATGVYQKAPLIKSEMRGAVAGLQEMMRGLDEVSEEVNKAISPEDPANPDTDAAPKENAVEVPQASDALFLAPAIAGQLMIFVGGLYFFLLCRQEVYGWLAQFTRGSDRATLEVFRNAERLVARYSMTVTLINAGLGVAVWAALQIVGMPGAALWAFVVVLMNFVMYLGPAIVAVALAVAGTVVFDGLYSIVPAAVFVGLNVIEGQFVTPTLVGHHMRVSPLLVFLSLCLWLWLWGPIGGIVAIPVLVWVLAVAKGLGIDQPMSDRSVASPIDKLDPAKG